VLLKQIRILMLAAACAAITAGTEPARSPVLVELFTSEGCSDCPPADTLLEKLDQVQPVAGADVIALSEHVDYWNSLGWSDPWSSALFSRRQESYAQRFHISGPYTPQMVVDGASEFVGSDGRAAVSKISAAAKAEKVRVRISRVGANVRVEVDAGRHQGGVFLAEAKNRTSSEVLRGENKGRSLHHIAVVRRLEQIGQWTGQAPFSKELAIAERAPDVRLIAFVQESGNGRVWGAAMLAPTTQASRP
jgi:hypothetical protein